jgi:hypothetical protein
MGGGDGPANAQHGRQKGTLQKRCAAIRQRGQCGQCATPARFSAHGGATWKWIGGVKFMVHFPSIAFGNITPTFWMVTRRQIVCFA